eukprot:4408234-Prymnesium_polylepis.2
MSVTLCSVTDRSGAIPPTYLPFCPCCYPTLPPGCPRSRRRKAAVWAQVAGDVSYQALSSRVADDLWCAVRRCPALRAPC